MRMKREFFKPKKKGVYLHFSNHTVSLRNGDLPFGDIEKRKLLSIIDRYIIKYNMDLISVVVMSNHFHILLYSHPEQFSLEEAHKIYNRFHKKGDKPVPLSSPRVESLKRHSNNFSEFMREVQREFSCWFNASRDYERQGALWSKRFHCQLIQTDAYLWACVKYLELNPVRANITEDPAKYSFSTFGRWSDQDRHPYQNNIITHLLPLINEKRDQELEEDVQVVKKLKNSMAAEMDIMKSRDLIKKLRRQGKKAEAIKLENKIEQAQQEQPQMMYFFSMRDCRGLVIGSERYLREQYHEWEALKTLERTG